MVASEAIGGTQKLSWDLRREIISPALINCKKRQNGFHHRGDRPRTQGRHQGRLTKTQEEESRAGVVSKRQSRKEASSDEKDKDAQRAPRTAQEESTRVEHSQRTSMLQRKLISKCGSIIFSKIKIIYFQKRKFDLTKIPKRKIIYFRKSKSVSLNFRNEK